MSAAAIFVSPTGANMSAPNARDTCSWWNGMPAAAAGIPFHHEHVSRALGADMFAPVGDTKIAAALIDSYPYSLISGELVYSASAGFDPVQRQFSPGRHDAAPDHQQGEHH